ncbi:restriction endonuclease [Membranihabitans maritimus]|uniref:restriction endonuclease n=1 Tax=Membranihabitans maritimus TaxID=2904244 RepID=UPI001F1B0C37|nr:restriction endonuclease [Membranihabitans maritimus]
MDFNQVDLKKFLKAAIKIRFQGISPYDFEDFVGQLFKDNGYKVKSTNYSGDFGADLILEKEGSITVVQIKRYHEENKVGVQDVNQVLGAANFYEAEQAMIVTTSTLSGPAKELCKKVKVFYWDWEILKDAIYTTYQLDDEWLFDVTNEQPEESDEYFEFIVKEVEVDEYLEDYKEALTKVILEMENNSGRNVNVFLDLPLILKHNNKQHGAVEWVDNYFKSGVIYNGAEVEIGCYFLERDLSEVKRGDKILIPVSAPGLSLLKTYITDLSPSDDRCFVVSYAYDKYSREYYTAVELRDMYLSKSLFGRCIVTLYYFFSPYMIRLITPFPFTKKYIKGVVSYTLGLVRSFYKIYNR